MLRANIVAEQNQRIKFNSSTPFTPTFVKANVTRSSDPAQIYTSRVQGRQILLDNPLRDSRTKQERAARKARNSASKARAQAGVIGKKEAKQKGLWKLAKNETKYHFCTGIVYMFTNQTCSVISDSSYSFPFINYG